MSLYKTLSILQSAFYNYSPKPSQKKALEDKTSNYKISAARAANSERSVFSRKM